MNYKSFFHYLSYIQYPFAVGSLYFIFKLNSPEIDQNSYFEIMNNLLVLLGLSISFASLQDTTKVSLKIEKKIWENPKLGKLFLIFITVMIFLFLIFGLFGYFFSDNKNIKTISFGIITVGIGFIGLLKSGIEIFDNFRKDKKLENE